VATALEPAQVQMNTVNDADVTCIGCHTSTPDGKYVGFTAQGPWGNVLASIEKMTATVVYVSTDVETTGRLDNGYADLYAVPYNARQGGTATPLPGASDPAFAEYYPAFSPDDAWIAFNRIPSGNNMYDQPLAELDVMPAAGGTAVRLAANDPVACSGKTSPGVTNSWPKWSPDATTAGDRTHYWLIFSSRRPEANRPIDAPERHTLHRCP
jgi:hypothetical protein